MEAICILDWVEVGVVVVVDVCAIGPAVNAAKRDCRIINPDKEV